MRILIADLSVNWIGCTRPSFNRKGRKMEKLYIATAVHTVIDATDFSEIFCKTVGDDHTLYIMRKGKAEILGLYTAKDVMKDALISFTEALERQGEPCYITEDGLSSYRLSQFEKIELINRGDQTLICGRRPENTVLLKTCQRLQDAEAEMDQIADIMAILRMSKGTSEQNEKLSDLGRFEALMRKHSLVIRTVPELEQHVFETKHKDRYPDGKIQYVEEYKRDMLVVKKIPEHAGEFIACSLPNTESVVKFVPKKYYSTLEAIVEDFR